MHRYIGAIGNMWTDKNTDGYSQSELDTINAEFEARFMAGEWPAMECELPECHRDRAEKMFADEIARR